MDKQGNLYTFLYASILVIVVAAVLAFVSTSLKPIQNKNIATAKKIDILKSVNIASDADNADELYSKYIIKNIVIYQNGKVIEGLKADAVDMAKEVKVPADKRKYPLYVCKLDDGQIKTIIPLRGTGLWGPIWGYISLNEDNDTVYGATFDHKGETPGLGAEISKDFFQVEFKGKTILDNGKFESIQVLKGGAAKGNPHAVDAISGGTITSKGVQKMLKDCLQGYVKYLKK